MANESLISVPPDLEDPIVLRRFLARLVEQLDIVLGNRAGPTKQYADQKELAEVSKELTNALALAVTELETALELVNKLTEEEASALTNRVANVEDKNSEQDTTLDTYGTKLDTIESGAKANIGTNLGKTISSTEVTISSSTGTNTQIPSATPTLAGVMTAADKTKLNNAGSTAEPYDNSDLYGIVTFMERV